MMTKSEISKEIKKLVKEHQKLSKQLCHFIGFNWQRQLSKMLSTLQCRINELKQELESLEENG